MNEIYTQLNNQYTNCNDEIFKKSCIEELESKKAPDDIIYQYDSEGVKSRHWFIVGCKKIVSIVIFPYTLFQAAVGWAILPASSILMKLAVNPDKIRASLFPLSQGGWNIKRIAIKVDGYVIDAAILHKSEYIHNKRWFLAANGNGMFYEQAIKLNIYDDCLDEIKANAVVFNYPGVGSSTGLLCKTAMKKAHLAVMKFIEDKEKGLGAKTIINYGWSMGGGSQGELYKDYDFQEGTSYLSIKDQTFSDLATEANAICCFPFSFIAKWLIKLSNWNLSSVDSSINLKHKEIIVQYATKEGEITDSKEVLSDGVIHEDASLAKKLMNHPGCPNDKVFYGTNQRGFLIWNNEKEERMGMHSPSLSEELISAIKNELPQSEIE